MNAITKIFPVDLESALDEIIAETEGLISTEIAKFAKGKWTNKDKPIKSDEKFRVELRSLTRIWQRWAGKKPVEKQVIFLGDRLPDREELGYNDDTRWDLDVRDGTPKDPWQLTWYPHLIRESDQEPFTFATQSWGGRKAISIIARERKWRKKDSAPCTPICTLSSAPEKSKDWGEFLRPDFKPWKWVPEEVTEDQALLEAPKTKAPSEPADHAKEHADVLDSLHSGVDPSEQIPF